MLITAGDLSGSLQGGLHDNWANSTWDLNEPFFKCIYDTFTLLFVLWDSDLSLFSMYLFICHFSDWFVNNVFLENYSLPQNITEAPRRTCSCRLFKNCVSYSLGLFLFSRVTTCEESNERKWNQNAGFVLSKQKFSLFFLFSRCYFQYWWRSSSLSPPTQRTNPQRHVHTPPALHSGKRRPWLRESRQNSNIKINSSGIFF